MQALAFYIVYPFLYLIASLPFRALYAFSDFACFLLKDVFKYRRDVIVGNLRNSFPEKSEKEIDRLANEYYRYLCDLILETLKTLTMTAKEAKERCEYEMPDWLKKFHEEGKSIIIVMGHYGNWEWGGPGFSLHTPYQLVVVYRPLSNPYFERMMTGMRTKFNTRIVPVANVLRDMVATRKQVAATAFIADQTASPESAYWTTFLNQETAVFTGPEKIAKKFDYPVVHVHIERVKRGYYRIHTELLFEKPSLAEENQILETFTRRLEKEIQDAPPYWLWSHKRWKHKRQPNA